MKTKRHKRKNTETEWSKKNERMNEWKYKNKTERNIEGIKWRNGLKTGKRKNKSNRKD